MITAETKKAIIRLISDSKQTEHDDTERADAFGVRLLTETQIVRQEMDWIDKELDSIEAELSALKPGDAAGIARLARRLRKVGEKIFVKELDAEEQALTAEARASPPGDGEKDGGP